MRKIDYASFYLSIKITHRVEVITQEFDVNNCFHTETTRNQENCLADSSSKWYTYDNS